MKVIQVEVSELNEMIKQSVFLALEEYDHRKNAVLITREEAAAILDVDISTLWRWSKCGTLKPKGRVGNKVVYERAKVEAIARGEYPIK